MYAISFQANPMQMQWIVCKQCKGERYKMIIAAATVLPHQGLYIY